MFQVQLKKKIRELIKEAADALHAFKSRGFGREIGLGASETGMLALLV